MYVLFYLLREEDVPFYRLPEEDVLFYRLPEEDVLFYLPLALGPTLSSKPDKLMLITMDTTTTTTTYHKEQKYDFCRQKPLLKHIVGYKVLF